MGMIKQYRGKWQKEENDECDQVEEEVEDVELVTIAPCLGVWVCSQSALLIISLVLYDTAFRWNYIFGCNNPQQRTQFHQYDAAGPQHFGLDANLLTT